MKDETLYTAILSSWDSYHKDKELGTFTTKEQAWDCARAAFAHMDPCDKMFYSPMVLVETVNQCWLRTLTEVFEI